MINNSDRWNELETRDGRDAFRDLSFEAALAIFAGLWAEAQALDSRFGQDWQEDLAADRAVARAVNGLPPAA